MNILHFVNSLNIGGLEKLLVDFVESLDEDSGKRVYVCLMNDSYNSTFLARIKERLGNQVAIMGKKEGSRNPLYFFKLVRYLYKMNIKIVHVHNNSTRNYCFLAKLFKPDIKIIMTIHHINYRPHKIRLLERFVTRYIGVSEAVYNTLVERVGDRDRISLIYNGINVSMYNLEKTRHERFNICCIGRIEPEIKGQDVLINAMHILKKYNKNIHCYFVGQPTSHKGTIPTHQMEYLTELIKRYRIEKEITFVGTIDNVPEFLKKMDLLVLPSRHEGFGLVIIEAMAAKVLVIASDIDGPREIVKDNEYAMLFESENAFDLADKIIACIGSDCRERRHLAFDYVMKTFDIKRMANNYMQLYKTIQN